MEKRKRLAALLCAVMMALTLLPVQAWATEEGALYTARYDAVTGQMRRERLPEGTVLQPFPTDEGDTALFADGEEDTEVTIDPYFLIIDENLPRYGLDMLSQMENGEALTNLYGLLMVLAFGDYYDDTSSEPGYYDFPEGVTYSMYEAFMVTQAFYADWPEIFWMWPGCLYTEDEPEVCVGLDMGYNDHFNNRKQKQQLFLSAANSILAGMPADGTDYEKELYLHDALVKHVTYDDAYVEEQNAYSALVNGMAVCSGYAFALQYLLMRAGIESYYVVGTAGEDENGKPVGHAWNIAKIGGVWYYVDPTWDDSDDEYAPYHAYFNLDTDLLTRDHVLDPYPYNVTLPQCNELRWFYHRYNGTEVFAGDNDLASTIAIWINYYKGAAHLYMNDADPTYLGTWFAQNHQKVAEAMGITGPYRYGIAWCGPEYVLSLETVSDDLNGDDSVDILDVQVLYAYLTTGVFSAPDTSLDKDTFLRRADINGDELIDVYDLQALYEIVCGIG